ncbi:hypothetical protein TNCV_328361 [Trichonephila clavipes]|nr:hypothetical protein TNCV_328361 [Trichonephila clavipes]
MSALVPVLVRKRTGVHLQPNCLRLRYTGPTPGVMVWEAISYDSRTTLIVILSKLTANTSSVCNKKRNRIRLTRKRMVVISAWNVIRRKVLRLDFRGGLWNSSPNDLKISRGLTITITQSSRR